MKRKPLLFFVLFTTCMALLFTGESPFASAANLDNVRVALLIDNAAIPAVTVDSKTGIVVNDSSGLKLFEESANTTMRVSPDQSYLMVKTSDDLMDAQQVSQHLSQNQIKNEILKAGRSFQVIAGPYSNEVKLAADKNKIVQQMGYTPNTKGRLRLDLGAVGSLQSALDLAGQLTKGGIDAYPVILTVEGKIQHRVWVGNETSKDTLQDIQDSIHNRFPDLASRMTVANQNQPYILLKDSVYGSNTITHLFFSSQLTLILEQSNPGNNSGLTLVEKDNRSYRGKIEFSLYKGAHTVVNELPLEEYLYSVVGSEMAKGWPLEALKAQAILSRTRVTSAGLKYGIAHVTDTVNDQAYYGVKMEGEDTRQAVRETAGLVVTYQGKPIETLYYSNAGGQTAVGKEVWGNDLPYIQSVSSEDNAPEKSAIIWYHIATNDGKVGYVRSDFISLTTEKNAAGFSYGLVNTSDLNFRSGPGTASHQIMDKLAYGETVVILEQVREDNPYSWIAGPYSGIELQQMLKADRPIESLQVTERGPSGRVMEVKANGKTVQVKSPDAFRTLFKKGNTALRSTLFEIDQLGRFTIQSANAQQESSSGLPLYAVQDPAEQSVPILVNNMIALGNEQKVNVLTQNAAFLFRGNGYGHGMGLSQYGAKKMAENGYDYRQILSHYYQDITIE
ncbi:SpoIID/LytB domain-containing protein [Ammoniphilus resinae]|uniref:Stage II sporulation protein D n=1 Tax=Ammoniphilus resinae TaxID=861532 RepID=A0ABS4GJJ9_9BACL|nr:SpoIID/LytB domain-containing protein [Ammoniphilus resinae]MBP1930434.1 stage II sporulation protein D [Ammoniphilus resinae]